MDFDHAEAAKLVGRESSVIRALDDVSKSDVRHWCELVGDADPSYTETIKRGEKTVPPTMMMVWAMTPLWPPQAEAREPHEKVLKMLDDAGYEGTVGIVLEQAFLRRVRLGDRLSFRVTLLGVSPIEEQTKLGKGHLVDLQYTFLDRNGEAISTQRYTVLKFRRLELPR